MNPPRCSPARGRSSSEKDTSPEGVPLARPEPRARRCPGPRGRREGERAETRFRFPGAGWVAPVSSAPASRDLGLDARLHSRRQGPGGTAPSSRKRAGRGCAGIPGGAPGPRAPGSWAPADRTPGAGCRWCSCPGGTQEAARAARTPRRARWPGLRTIPSPSTAAGSPDGHGAGQRGPEGTRKLGLTRSAAGSDGGALSWSPGNCRAK